MPPSEPTHHRITATGTNPRAEQRDGRPKRELVRLDGSIARAERV